MKATFSAASLFMLNFSTAKAKQPREFSSFAWVPLIGKHLDYAGVSSGPRVTCDSRDDTYFEASAQMPLTDLIMQFSSENNSSSVLRVSICQ